MINILLRICAFSLYIARMLYWIYKQEVRGKQEENASRIRSMSKFFTYSIDILVLLQLIGLPLLPISGNILFLQVIGMVLVMVGVGICIIARDKLADNWAYGAEYKIKKNQHLITKGIYAYIRHPIYFGATLMYIGAEMVSKSYLFISFLSFFIVFYIQSKREEKLLLAHFGNSYKVYMNKTKMFFPFLF